EGQIVPGQVQQRIQQHGAMPCAQDKTISIEPVGVAWVMAQVTGPQRISHRSGAHRQAGMTAVGFLHSIYRQRTNGVDCQRLQVGAQGVPPWLFGSDNTPPILPYNPSARRSWFG